MSRNTVKEHFEERLDEASRQIRELEAETERAGADATPEMRRALDHLKKQRDELAQTIDRFEEDTRNAVDDLTETVDTALGNLEENLRNARRQRR